jgi:hypothetical protein
MAMKKPETCERCGCRKFFKRILDEGVPIPGASEKRFACWGCGLEVGVPFFEYNPIAEPRVKRAKRLGLTGALAAAAAVIAFLIAVAAL